MVWTLAVADEVPNGLVSLLSRTIVPSALAQKTTGALVLWLVVMPHGPCASSMTPPVYGSPATVPTVPAAGVAPVVTGPVRVCRTVTAPFVPLSAEPKPATHSAEPSSENARPTGPCTAVENGAAVPRWNRTMLVP